MVSVKCRYCDRPAVTIVRYAKLNLCTEHFSEFIESRVEETIKRYRMIKKGDRVVLAVSGGKDSVGLMYIMNSLSKRIGFSYTVLHIDLGIDEYSRRSRKVVEKHCRELGIDCIVIDLGIDLGFTLPQFVSKLRTKRVCSLCGIVKRYIMNAVALETKADSIATAHHADDILVYLFKNFILQDYTFLKKLVPVSIGVEETVATKIRPMYEIYERDIALYTILKGLEFVDLECPFKNVKGFEESIKKFIDEIENRAPGTKISMLRKYAKTFSLDRQEKSIDLGRCSICGLISQKDVCTFCKLTEKAFGQAKGSLVKEITRSRCTTYCVKPHLN
ncbi:MAG: TIGR00269 family protein [Ignisphaera sp.]